LKRFGGWDIPLLLLIFMVSIIELVGIETGDISPISPITRYLVLALVLASSSALLSYIIFRYKRKYLARLSYIIFVMFMVMYMLEGLPRDFQACSFLLDAKYSLLFIVFFLVAAVVTSDAVESKNN